mmetsp:Transcript_81183/g.262406  ORF Transcript_81183/g.262406 Transcript_81183/m.262406 type:complete len:201 (+) Transcript_81183:720-1322(+)
MCACTRMHLCAGACLCMCVCVCPRVHMLVFCFLPSLSQRKHFSLDIRHWFFLELGLRRPCFHNCGRISEDAYRKLVAVPPVRIWACGFHIDNLLLCLHWLRHRCECSRGVRQPPQRFAHRHNGQPGDLLGTVHRLCTGALRYRALPEHRPGSTRRGRFRPQVCECSLGRCLGRLGCDHRPLHDTALWALFAGSDVPGDVP